MTTNDKLADALRLIERMRDLLRANEFDAKGYCPVCSGWMCSENGCTPKQHMDDCPLTAAVTDATNLLAAHAASLAAPPAQGEWVMVPREPTSAMIGDAHGVDTGHGSWPREAWRRMLAAAPQPAPAPVQVDDALGRFGHHPDPATDFEVEVTSLQGRLFNAKHAIPDKYGVTESVAQVADAIKRAMTFRVGGVETSVRAKSILRALELDAAQPPAPEPVQVDDGWHCMTQAARDMQARHLDNHQGDVYHAMQSLVGRFGAPRTGPMIQDRSAQPPAPGEAELPAIYDLILKAVNDASPRWGDQHDNPMSHKLSMREREWISGRVFAAIAALAQQRVPDAVRELPMQWRTGAHRIVAAATACGNVTEADEYGAHLVRLCATDLESALASAEGNAVDLVQFRYAVEGWRDCARALAKVCDRPADCAYAEAESVRLLDLIDQQQEARNGQ